MGGWVRAWVRGSVRACVRACGVVWCGVCVCVLGAGGYFRNWPAECCTAPLMHRCMFSAWRVHALGSAKVLRAAQEQTHRLEGRWAAGRQWAPGREAAVAAAGLWGEAAVGVGVAAPARGGAAAGSWVEGAQGMTVAAGARSGAAGAGEAAVTAARRALGVAGGRQLAARGSFGAFCSLILPRCNLKQERPKGEG
mgnify:CR=1 FL=1